jgi:hypothetical protein
MAELFFPQYGPRRQAPDLPVGLESRNAELAARNAQIVSRVAGATADAALQRAGQSAQLSQQGFSMAQASAEALVKYREIERREQLVIQETRAGHALAQAKQAAQNEIDLYLTSPESRSHTNPEEIPQEVGAILERYGSQMMSELGQYDPIVQQNAGLDYQNFGQGIVPQVRKEKTARIKDQAIAASIEFEDVQKKEFFRAETPEARQRAYDSILGRWELLREQGLMTAQDEEKRQIVLSKDLLMESIAEMRRSITLDTSPDVIAQGYGAINATSLSPKEKETLTHALDSHISGLLNHDAQRRNLESQARKQREEEVMKQIVIAGVQDGDWRSAMEMLNQGLQAGVIDTPTYLQRRNEFLRMQQGPELKHSDQNARMQLLVLAKTAGSPGSPIQSMNDWMRIADQYKGRLTGADLGSAFVIGLGEIEEEAGRSQRASIGDAKADRKTAFDQGVRDFKAWFSDTAHFPGLPGVQGTAEDSQLVSIAQGRLISWMDENPSATPKDINIFVDELLLENDKVVQKLFRERNANLYDRTIGIEVKTIEGLDAELAAGRITQAQHADLAEFIVFRDKRLKALDQQPAGATPGVPSAIPPKPKAQQGSSQDVLKSWWNWGIGALESLTPDQQQDAKSKAEGEGLGAYFNRHFNRFFGSGGTGGAPPPRPPNKQE